MEELQQSISIFVGAIIRILTQLIDVLAQLGKLAQEHNENVNALLGFTLATASSNPYEIYELWNLIKDCPDALCVIKTLRESNTEKITALIPSIQKGLLGILDGLEYDSNNLDWDTLEILFTMPERFRSIRFGDVELSWVWIRDGELIPANPNCSYSGLHPAQLSGQELAHYMNCVIADASENDKDWMDWLPDFNPNPNIRSIDPLDPLSIPDYVSYLGALPPCDYDESGKAAILPCQDSIRDSGLLWSSAGEYLPLKLTEDNRRYVAQATMDLWYLIGINQTPEEFATWANNYEHGFENIEAQRYTSELFHYAYRTIFLNQGNESEEKSMLLFIEWTSAALFTQAYADPYTVEQRGLRWLLRATTPIEGDDPSYLTMSQLDWDNLTTTDYRYPVYSTTGGELPRTFGTTEVTQFTNPEDKVKFEENKCGLLWEEFVGAPNSGIYVMTRDQQNNARRILNPEDTTTTQNIIDELGGCNE